MTPHEVTEIWSRAIKNMEPEAQVRMIAGHCAEIAYTTPVPDGNGTPQEMAMEIRRRICCEFGLDEKGGGGR
jgi:uncharacterized hydantoinase/oxoprolinase family protein